LPYNAQKPEQWWQSLRKAKNEDFDQSPITSISEDAFLKLFNGMMKYPEGSSAISKGG
jgi:2-oxoglutarate dehydrogenase E1 component